MSLTNPFLRNAHTIVECYRLLLFQGRNSRPCLARRFFTADQCSVPRTSIKGFASRNSMKKESNDRTKSKTNTLQENNLPLEGFEEFLDNSPPKNVSSSDISAGLSGSDIDLTSSIMMPTRSTVLRACILTSGFLLALGMVIRQASHVASIKGWAILDSYTEVSFDFEMWHIELIIGLVILISSSRYVLLKTWQDFSESSEAANKQVLSSLQLLDYVVVAFLPGISEELLFRGALMPLFGLNWKSALAIGAVFGCLHLGSGRKYSFAVWATFVGFAYGLATIISSSVIVPMVSHSLNNLVGGILWRYTSSEETNE